MTSPSGASCPRCGTGVNPASRFCANCGESLSGEVRLSVGAAVAPQGRLSDSGALEMKTLLVAATHGDYEIQEELGRGGMAVVYRGIEVHLKRPVAIKVLPPDLTYAKGATERFQREAQTAAALDHPNIIPIYRISAGGKLCWYAMKYLEGRSLADILAQKGLLTVSETILILEQIGSALDYAHKHGVIHRDVKPGNVMLDVNGRVTVTDFGIAKELTGGALTGSGAILGTPYYMSPEQCRGGREITGAADQYSLAVMAYQMVSGQLPFDADSAIDVIHKHVSEPPPPLETLLPGLPRHVVSAINRGLAKKAEDRFPSVASFVAALRHAPDEKTLMMERMRRRSGIEKAPTLAGSTRRVAAGLVLIGGLAGGIWWLAVNTGIGAPVAEPRTGTGAPAGRSGAVAPTHPAASGATQSRKAEPPPSRNARTSRPQNRPGPAALTPPVRGAAEANPPAPAGSTPAATQPQAHTATAPAGAAQPPAAGGPQGTARIGVSPTFATITISGRGSLGEKRAWAGSLPAGNYTVTFERQGYETQTRPLRITAGQETALSVTMRPTGHP